MTTVKQVSAKRRYGNRRGNVLVEMSLVMLPTLALICAFADIGMVIFTWSTMQHAVSEGVRYAITFQQQADPNNPGKYLGQDTSIEDVVATYALGLVKANSNPQRIFVRYYSPGDLNTPINPGGNVPGNIVEVSVENYPWNLLAPLSGSLVKPIQGRTSIGISAFSSDILGGYPVGVLSVPR